MPRSKPHTKTSHERNIISISDYLEEVNRYNAYPGRLLNGEMFVLLSGKWIEKAKFEVLVKRPIMPDFRVNLNNVDKTKNWMFQ